MVLHFSTIMQPDKLVFDEQYYIPAAKSILQGAGTDRIEHPPLAQLIIAAGIWLFGDNPLGWRFLPVVFGIIGLIFFYLICRQLKMTRKYAYLATFLLSFENQTFIQSSIAMLDVFSLAFMMASFWLYLKGRYITSGAMVGLAILSKLTGVLAALVIIVHWLLTDRTHWKRLFIFIVVTLATFWILMPLLEFTIWHKWLNPLTQVRFMLDSNSLATFAHHPLDAMLSRPWDWLIRPIILTYWIDPHYLAMISPPIWALIIPATIFIALKSWRPNNAAIFALTWFAGTYLVWIPVSLATERISYIFYFYPAVGAICIALSLAFSDLDNITGRVSTRATRGCLRLIMPVYLLLCLGAFVILSPVTYWWKVPLCAVAYVVSRYYFTMEGS